MDPGAVWQCFENLHLRQNSSLGTVEAAFSLPSSRGAPTRWRSSQAPARLPAGPGAGLPPLPTTACPARSVGSKQGLMGIFLVKLKQQGECGVRSLFYTLLSLLTLCSTSHVISVGHERQFLPSVNLKGCLYSFRAAGIMQGDLYFLYVLVPFPHHPCNHGDKHLIGPSPSFWYQNIYLGLS